MSTYGEEIGIKGTTKRIYDYILTYTDEHGYQPSFREIADEVGIKSVSTVFYHLDKLETLGYIKKSASKNRAIELKAVSAKKPTREIPIVGKVAAGLPILAVENIADTIELPENLFGGSFLFFLKVQGDSMINAGIFNGDLIAVNKQENADNGDIVVAMIDDEVTVKRFYKEKDYVRLQAENEKYAPILTKNAVIVGKVVGLLRSRVL